ncbi:hypothetical protein BOX15_Mlig001957g1 [Macrostomum lignano]|uniref:Uncharacterized protein n=1 Tax=Macrostomum lignano TaxID=282301 RepID=A0A267FC53_9PLAT|nr:hypothetical protein BOX15_Mlig001957g1 [Macrostomum lignano]
MSVRQPRQKQQPQQPPPPPLSQPLQPHQLLLQQEDSNDSGLSSEASAYSRDVLEGNPNYQYQQQHQKPQHFFQQQQLLQQRAVHFGPPSSARPRLQQQRRLPRTPSTDTQLSSHSLQRGQQAINSTSSWNQPQRQEYSSDSELHQSYSTRRAGGSGGGYASADEGTDFYHRQQQLQAPPPLPTNALHPQRQRFASGSFELDRGLAGLAISGDAAVDYAAGFAGYQGNGPLAAGPPASDYRYYFPYSATQQQQQQQQQQRDRRLATAAGNLQFAAVYGNSADGSNNSLNSVQHKQQQHSYAVDEYGRRIKPPQSQQPQQHHPLSSGSWRQLSADCLKQQPVPYDLSSPTYNHHQQQQQLRPTPPPSRQDVANLGASAVQKFRVKDWELARFAAKVNRLEFRPCPTERRQTAQQQQFGLPAAELPGVDGVIRVHVIAGVGLHSSHAVLRDLYCLTELDSARTARSMIRTSTDCFEWDEQFDLFASGARTLGFLLYQWDPKCKHRLCFYGSISLSGLFVALRQRGTRSEKLALGLEPRGELYVELTHFTIGEVMCRTQPHRAAAAASSFGSPIELAAKRDRQSVPSIVRRCIDEVENRGLDVPGIYRLCGSNKSKMALREAFEQQQQQQQPRSSGVDLSAEKVPDIHAVTGVLKDYLREMPEPLFTNALYRMLIDALAVQIPGDPRGGAKLMLSILDCLPPVNQETLLLLLDHLKRVALRSSVNKMTIDQLSTCLAPMLLYPSPQAARQMDPRLLQLDRMIEVLRFIMQIWMESNDPAESHSRGSRRQQQQQQQRSSMPSNVARSADVGSGSERRNRTSGAEPQRHNSLGGGEFDRV